MAERPYTVLSCGMSIDGYLDSAGDERLILSNDADLDRVDEVRAGCDAILVGATTVRNDDPRLLVRDPTAGSSAVARGFEAHAPQGDGHLPGRARPERPVLHDRDAEKLVYCPSAHVAEARGPGSARSRPSSTAGGRVSMRRLSEDLHQRGVRRLMVEGGGTIHTQFLTEDSPTSCSWSSRRSSSATPRPAASSTTARSRSRPAARPTLADVRRIGEVVLLRYALSERFEEAPGDRHRPHRAATLPLRLPRRLVDARRGVVTSFDGLADAARAPGARRLGQARTPRAAGAGAQRVPHRRRARQQPVRLRPAAARVGGADRGRPAATCSTCARRVAGSGSTPSSTPTPSRTRGLDTYEANVALGYGEDERDYTVAAQMLPRSA